MDDTTSRSCAVLTDARIACTGAASIAGALAA